MSSFPSHFHHHSGSQLTGQSMASLGFPADYVHYIYIICEKGTFWSSWNKYLSIFISSYCMLQSHCMTNTARLVCQVMSVMSCLTSHVRCQDISFHMSDTKISNLTCQVPRHPISHVIPDTTNKQNSCDMYQDSHISPVRSKQSLSYPHIMSHVIQHAVHMQKSDQCTSQGTTLYDNKTRPKTRRQVFRDRYAMSS
jgi:hypothetical protein